MENKTPQKSPMFSTPVILLLIAAAFIVGMFYNRMQTLEKKVAELSSGTQTTTTGNSPSAVGNNPQPNVQAGNAQAPAVQTADDVNPVTDQDHVRGDRQARIMLIEYSDLECPFCKQFHPTAQQILDDYNGQVAWVYRHFPIAQLHSKAPNEAVASECVAELGGEDKFWAYVDKIFATTPSNNGLSEDQLPVLAGQVGINQSQFQTCLDSGKTKSVVEADYQSGIKAGVNATPTNILLDTKTGKTQLIPGALPLTQMKQAIDGMLAQS